MIGGMGDAYMMSEQLNLRKDLESLIFNKRI